MVEEKTLAAGPAGPAGTRARPASASNPGLSAALAASTLLAACGGGGGGNGGDAGGGPAAITGAGSLAPLANTQTAAGYAYTGAKSDAEAARFLLHAQGYATDSDLAAVRSLGYLPWLAQQFDAPRAPAGWDWMNSRSGQSGIGFDNMVWAQLMASPDGMRKRMALALSEIFVVSGTDIGSSWPHHMMSSYWDTLVAGVTGDFRGLLEAVTLNPAMGYYLNTKGNQKENSQGRQPDENFAREVMQLMTIGLVQLDSKGQPRQAPDGSRLETYTQDDVTNLARVFTGYDLNIAAGEENAGASNLWTARPMALFPARHSTLAANFLGASVPANTDGKTALRIALDTLAGHPNVGPFIGRQLIQRLVTSNPSPDYVGRVAAVFENNGAGVRGDMRSVFAAVLLDNEARGPQGLSSPDFGRLREPMLRLVQWARTFGAVSALGTWPVGNTTSPSGTSFLGQSPLRSPSVFNFFRPGYVPPSTAMAGKGMVAPEFQLVNETTVGAYLNFMQGCIQNGLGNKDVVAAYTAEKALVLDIPALVDRLNLLLCAGQLSGATTDIIRNALATPVLTTASSDASKANRLYSAVLLVMGCPEYLIQK